MADLGMGVCYRYLRAKIPLTVNRGLRKFWSAGRGQSHQPEKGSVARTNMQARNKTQSQSNIEAS